VEIAAQEERDGGGGADEVDDGSDDDHDADGGDSRNIGKVEGESTDNDVDREGSSDDGDGEIVDDAEGDVGDDVFSVFSTSDNDPDGDDAEGAVDDGRDVFITTDGDDHLDENGADGYDRRLNAWCVRHHRADYAYKLHLEKRVDLVPCQSWVTWYISTQKVPQTSNGHSFKPSMTHEV
jgi:hypothetical protein